VTCEHPPLKPKPGLSGPPVQVEGGLLSYWGSNLGNISADQLIRSIDIIVRPSPSEDDVESRSSIAVLGQPSLYLGTNAMELHYQRRELSRFSEFSKLDIFRCQ